MEVLGGADDEPATLISCVARCGEAIVDHAQASEERAGTLAAVANPLLLLPDFLLILIGWVICRRTALDRPVWDAVERLVYYLLFPVLLFNSIVKSPLQPAQAAKLALAALAMLAVASPWRWCLGRCRHRRRRHASVRRSPSASTSTSPWPCRTARRRAGAGVDGALDRDCSRSQRSPRLALRATRPVDGCASSRRTPHHQHARRRRSNAARPDVARGRRDDVQRIGSAALAARTERSARAGVRLARDSAGSPRRCSRSALVMRCSRCRVAALALRRSARHRRLFASLRPPPALRSRGAHGRRRR